MKNWMKKAAAICMALMLVAGITACGGSDSNKEKEEGKTYTVATEPTFPPFDTTDEEGNIVGFDMDLMNAIAEDQGFKVEFTSLNFDGLIPALQSGNADIVAAGMWANDERKEKVDFTETYFDSGVVLAVANDNNSISGPEALTSDMKIAYQVGTSSMDVAQKLEKEGKIAKAVGFDKVNDAVQAVKTGEVDGLFNDKPVTLEYMNQQPDVIKIVGDNVTTESYGIAVKKGNTELLDKINKGLKNLKENGKFDELLKKWDLAEK